MKNISQNKIQFSALAVLFFSFVILFFPAGKASALTLTPIRLEISGDKGQVLKEQMTLINEQNTAQTYYSSYANFDAQGETGTPNFIEAKEDIGTWMSSISSVTLPAKSSKIIDIKISIPADAEAGGHFGVIFWGDIPPNTSSGNVAIGTKAGLLVLLTVNGEVAEKAGILEFATKDKQTFFNSLPISFYYRFKNDGGNRIKPVGDIIFKNIFGLTTDKISGNPVEGNVLPNQTRRFETVWQKSDAPETLKINRSFFEQAIYEFHNFAFGRYKANLNLEYGLKGEKASADFSFWVFPWHFLLSLLVILFLIFFIFRFIAKKYNHWVIGKAEVMLEEKEEHSHEDHSMYTHSHNDTHNEEHHKRKI